jgi:probable HAF family extracellular repeat protein
MQDEDTWQAFLFEPASGLRDIGVPSDWRKFTLTALNDAGQFAGAADNAFVDEITPTEAYLWDPATGWTGFGRGSGVQDLNNEGQVLVNISGTDVPEHPLVLWTPGNTPRDLAAAPAGMLNEAGQAVTSSPPDLAEAEQTQVWDLATGHQLAAAEGHAYGINDNGQVILDAGIPPASPLAQLLDLRGRLTDLGTLPGADWATPRGINNQGQVVGFSGTGPLGDAGSHGSWFHAFLWDERTGMHDLGTLSKSHNSQALAINSTGQVIGWSGQADPRSPSQAVLWSPRP